MSRLVLPLALLRELRTRLLGSSLEACAVLFGRALKHGGRLTRVVVRDVLYPSDHDYIRRNEIAAELSPAFVAVVAKRARQCGESIIFVHSHPLGLNAFSQIDDAGERVLADFLEQRTPHRIHVAMLVTPDVTIARVLGTDESLEVAGVGQEVAWGTSDSSSEDDTFDRQTRAFGQTAQNRLSRMRIGIVGLGGTGSIVAEQLAHLGVRKFLLIDPDVVERSNLNRLVGASPAAVGKQKVAVAAAQIERINAAAISEQRVASVLLSKVAEELADTDFVFCCTDSQGSRAVLNQLAYQYLIPTIDMGAVIVVTSGRVSHIAGRTQMLSCGLGCLVCGNLLDPEAVRVDLLTDFERAQDQYVVGLREPAPAVISLNSTVSSMAITMFLAAVSGVPSMARLINYNGITGAARVGTIPPHPTCVVCSRRGALGRGDEWPLPARQS